MANEYLETLGKYIRYKKEYVGNDTYRLFIKKNELELLEKELQRLEAIDNANPSEALAGLKRIKFHLLERLRIEDNTEDFIKEYERIFFEPIKQSLLKAQQQEKELETVRADLTIELNNKKNAIKMFKQERKLREKQEKVLEILKPYLRLVDNFLQARVNFYDDYWLIVKEITDEKELDSLKKILGQAQI